MLRSLITAAMLLFVSNAIAGETGVAAEAPAAAPLSVRSLAAGTDVQARRLIGEADTFLADGSHVWVHVAVENRGAPSNITMVWFLDDEEIWQMDLKVGTSARWRTWSRSKMGPHRTGAWRVEVRDPAGEVIGEARFDVQADPIVDHQASLDAIDDPGC